MTEDRTLEETPESFEELSHDNGHTWWWQSDLMEFLGYTNPNTFSKPVGKAMSALTSLNISVQENFQHGKRVREDGTEVNDVKLSRFACYLATMNADPRKPPVAYAQAYFATLAEVARQYILEGEHVERLLIRDEVSDRERVLSSTAMAAGVQNYAFFQNAGYRGLYNRNLSQLRDLKGVPQGRTLLDFMGKEELAANLFRITQTESKIKSEGVRGQRPLEQTAETVGRRVRRAIEEIGGTMPEQLPPAGDIKEVKKGIKKAGRELAKFDKKRLSAPKKRTPEKEEPDEA